jgi:outer membrane protein TolC
MRGTFVSVGRSHLVAQDLWVAIAREFPRSDHSTFASFMVLSGLSFQRVFSSAVLAILTSVSTFCLRAAGPEEVVGTMPEDYLPGLKTILADSRHRSPEMVARSFEHVIQEARFTMAKSARLPNVGGNFDYGITQTATASNTSSQSRNTGAQYSFNVGQALFHWGAIKNEIEISRLNLTATSKETAKLYRDTSVALRKAYLALIVEKARLQQGREAFALLEKEVEVAKTKKADGTISGAALAGEELRLRETRLQVDRANEEFEMSRRRFSRAAGMRETIAEDAIPDDIPRPANQEALAAVITAQLLKDNAKTTIEAEVYDIRLQEAVRRQKIVATRLLPKFGLGASYSLRNNTYVNGVVVNQEAVTEERYAVSGSWNIFDGFATGGAKREAAANRRALEHRKSMEIDQLLQTVQQLERSVRLDAEQLVLAETRHGIATTGYELIKEGIELGNLPKSDLQRGQLGVMDARATNLLARATYLGRWAELVATAGFDPVLNNFAERNGRKTE